MGDFEFLIFDLCKKKGMSTTVALGLKENWKQFTLLVIVNAFVG